MSDYQYVKNSRQRLKQRLLYVMGEKCCICGYNKCASALEFHHKDPTQKDFTLGLNANIAFEKANEEIKKCILVCANCHREIHQGMIDVSNYSCYNEQRAEEKRQELQQLKTHTIYYCKECGKIISNSKAMRCVECHKKSLRVAERPSREELKQLIRQIPFTKIAEQYGVTDNSIRKWCDAYNLPRRKKDIAQYSDEDWFVL